MECLEEYLNINSSYKDYYIKNNDEIKSEIVTNQSLYFYICSDIEIILNGLNISPSKLGYRYWKDAVFIFLLNNGEHISICNDIYPAIAKRYGKTSMSVERAMRICLENAMYYNSKKEQCFVYEYLKNYLLYPHNSEILVKLVELVISKEFQKIKYSI